MLTELNSLWCLTKMNSFKRRLATKKSPQLEWKTQLDRKSIMFIEDVAAVLRSHYTDNSAEYCRSKSSPAAVNSSGNNALPSSEKKPVNLFQAFVWEARKPTARSVASSRKSIDSEQFEENRKSVYEEVDVSDSFIRSLWDEPL
jgi:hypothetical protein